MKTIHNLRMIVVETMLHWCLKLAPKEGEDVALLRFHIIEYMKAAIELTKKGKK